MAKNKARKKVLIIEDEDNIAKAEGLILEHEFEVFYAKDGEEGFDMAKRIKPKLIVLDLMLPKRGGYDLCFNLRQDPELRDIKVLMVTALTQEIDHKKGRMVGADHYLTKPFEPEELFGLAMKLANE